MFSIRLVQNNTTGSDQIDHKKIIVRGKNNIPKKGSGNFKKLDHLQY